MALQCTVFGGVPDLIPGVTRGLGEKFLMVIFRLFVDKIIHRITLTSLPQPSYSLIRMQEVMRRMMFRSLRNKNKIIVIEDIVRIM